MRLHRNPLSSKGAREKVLRLAMTYVNFLVSLTFSEFIPPVSKGDFGESTQIRAISYGVSRDLLIFSPLSLYF